MPSDYRFRVRVLVEIDVEFDDPLGRYTGDEALAAENAWELVDMRLRDVNGVVYTEHQQVTLLS
jgi:hypothetical protein